MTDRTATIDIPLCLPRDEARALAQFVKRTGHDDCQRLGNRHDGGVEAEQMWSAVQKLAICPQRQRLQPAMTTRRPALIWGPAFLHGRTRHTQCQVPESAQHNAPLLGARPGKDDHGSSFR
jgi:hypothetical protein